MNRAKAPSMSQRARETLARLIIRWWYSPAEEERRERFLKSRRLAVSDKDMEGLYSYWRFIRWLRDTSADPEHGAPELPEGLVTMGAGRWIPGIRDWLASWELAQEAILERNLGFAPEVEHEGSP